MEKFFKLKENNTTVGTEILAGLTTFFAMSYILFVNPSILSASGMPFQAVFLATIIAAAIGTLVMGLFANVPYAQAPGMGLNAFFTYTVVFAFGYQWQEALAMVFICGIINILITVTKIRKLIIRAIPESLQHAIGGGIGIFIAYIGIKNAGLLQFTSDSSNIQSAIIDGDQVVSAVTSGGIVPALVHFNTPGVLLAIIGIILTAVLILLKVKGGMLIGIILTTAIGIPLGVVDVTHINFASNTLGDSFRELGTTFGAAFGNPGMGSLFGDASRLPQVLMTCLAFSLADTFDTIGTFIGTGRRTGIFSKEDELALENSKGFKTKMDKALFSDAIATSVGAVFGTSNTTTYVESAAGIGVGGRTGLTAVVVGILFLLSSFLSPIIGVVPGEATAPALIMVGIMMLSSFKEVQWDQLAEAIPAFFTAIFMGFCYSITDGIAAGFVFYVVTKLVTKQAKDISPILWVATGLFILNWIILAVM